MTKILSIIKKDLKLILRSRVSALIILLGPLLIMLIVGLAFNSTATVRINIGYYAPDDSNMTQSFVDLLHKENYKVKKFASTEECRGSIADGTNHICLLFPRDFVIANNKSNEIVFLVDNSKMNFFETVVDSIEKDFNEKAEHLTEGMTQELLDKLNQTQGSLTTNFDTVSNLKSENALIRQDVDKITQEISNLDLSFDVDDLRVDVLEEQSTNMDRQIDNIKRLADRAIDAGLTGLDDIEDGVLDLNLSNAEEDSMLDIINDSRSDIQNIEDELNNTGNFDSAQLEKTVKDLKDNLDDVQTRFVLAAGARDVSVDRIKGINDKLNSSMAKILAVEQTFNLIYANIQSTEITNLQSITQPIEKRVESVLTEQNQLNFIFPYLVVLVIMFIGLLLASTLIIMEKTSSAHFRNFVTPTNDITFVIGAYLTTFIIIALQLFVVIMIFAFYFQRDVVTNLQATLFVLALIITLFSWLGMAVGNLFNSEETGTLASISIGSILLFVSGLIFPLERMPDKVADIAGKYNPFVIGTEMLRKTMIHLQPLDKITPELLVMLVYIVVIFLILIATHKLMKRTYLLQWGGYIARRKLRLQERGKMDKALYQKYATLKEEEYFMTKDKKRLSNLVEMAEYVKSLSGKNYDEYVHDDTNLFADWVQDVLINEPLALQLRKTKTQKKCIAVLRKGRDEYKKLHHRLNPDATAKRKA